MHLFGVHHLQMWRPAPAAVGSRGTIPCRSASASTAALGYDSFDPSRPTATAASTASGQRSKLSLVPFNLLRNKHSLDRLATDAAASGSRVQLLRGLK
jgi:hypothetical protein